MNSRQIELTNLRKSLPRRKSIKSLIERPINRDLKNKRSCINKYFTVFKDLSLLFQIPSVYAILLAFFLIVIIISKYYFIKFFVRKQFEKNYYNTIINHTINKQRDLKNKLDILNNEEYLLAQHIPLIFMELFTLELNRLGFLNVDNPFIEEKIKDTSTELYKDLGGSFILDKNLNEIIDGNPYGYIIPFFYHTIPILYQTSSTLGMNISSFIYTIHNTDCTRNFFFKYPIEKEELENIINMNNSIPKSYEIFDYVHDPITDCIYKSHNFSNSDEADSNFKEKAKRNNFYYKFEQNFINEHKQKEIIESRLLNVLKITELGEKIDYFIHHITMTLNDDDIVYLGFKINKSTIKKNFIILDKDNNTESFDEFVLINYSEDSIANKSRITNNSSDGIYYWRYNYDDGPSIIYNTPRFINDFFKYSMSPKRISELVTSDSLKFDQETFILKYDILNSIYSNFSINYYFKEDTSIFQLIVFLNQYLSKGHKCYGIDIEKYYDIIKTKSNCLNDYCFYNNCTENVNHKSNKYYKDPEKKDFMPDCYCIPLFCRDENSDNNTLFHNLVKDSFSIKDNYNYGFTKTNNKSFNCTLNFYQKSGSNSSTFDIKIYLKDNFIEYKTSSVFVMLLNNNKIILSKIYNFFYLKIRRVLKYLFYGYSCLLGFLIIICTWDIAKNTKKLIKRMDNVIIEISNSLSDQKLKRQDKSDIKDCDSSIDYKKAEEKEELIEKGDKKIKKNDIVENNDSNDNDDNDVNDELSFLKNLFLENISEFKLDFDVNEDTIAHFSQIKKNYYNVMSINSFEKSLFRKDGEDNNNSYRDNDSGGEKLKLSVGDEINEDGFLFPNKQKADKVSLNILFELYSLSSNELFDFNKIKPNFYHRDHHKESFIDIQKYMDTLKDNEKLKYNEIIDKEKLENALNYYYDNAHVYWKRMYERNKREGDH